MVTLDCPRHVQSPFGNGSPFRHCFLGSFFALPCLSLREGGIGSLGTPWKKESADIDVAAVVIRFCHFRNPYRSVLLSLSSLFPSTFHFALLGRDALVSVRKSVPSPPFGS